MYTVRRYLRLPSPYVSARRDSGVGGPIWSDVEEGADVTAAWLLAGANANVCVDDDANRRRAERSFILGVVSGNLWCT